jgi:tRNA threonylcarbamoyl adenosine modification protein YeaZ
MARFFNMKTTLAIDTSTARTQFAVLKGNELLWLQTEDGATTHGDVLAKFGALAAKENIDQVIVGMGPGPFTGLRTGIVFAQSFAFARGLPVHGVCSLDAISYGIDFPEFIVATDARRKELYWARYVDGKRVGEPVVSAPSEIPNLPIFGEGAMKYDLSSDTENLYPKLIAFPELAHVNEPMYLRHPDAVPTADRK